MNQRDRGTFRERIARNRRNSMLLIAAFLAVVTVFGALTHSGLSFFSLSVATFMKRPQIGTARSAAYPFAMIVRGMS